MKLFLFLTLLCRARADYDCICNYNVEKAVFQTKSDTSSKIGYLYEFDCKQQMRTQHESASWEAIAFEHKIGYVQKDDQVNVQVCPGDPPVEDMVTSPQPAVATNVTAQSTFISNAAITTTMPTLTTGTIVALTNSSNTCPLAAQRAAVTDNGVLIINHAEGKCYVFVQSHHSWSTSENACNKNGGHLVTVRNENENKVLFEYVKEYGHNTWLGLSDRQIEETFTWTSGENISYSNWLPGRKDSLFHSFENCVCMVPSTGRWEDLGCSRSYAYICEYGSVPNVNGTSGLVPSINTHGNTHLCPTSSILAARRDNNIILGQYGQSCYELHNHSLVTWTSAESTCKHHSGHLVHIRNIDEQNFIEAFLTHYSPQHAAWIGLYDKNNESNFEWTSGEAVTYTNWVPSHNETSHESKDCVILLPNQSGQWDEVYCGSHGFFFGSHTERHLTLCQYRTVTHTSSILIG